MMLSNLYSGYYNVFLYLLSFLTLILGVVFDTNLSIAVQFFIFLIWDVFFILNEKNFKDRHVEGLSMHISRSSNFITAFLPFYGVLLGILFALDLEKQRAFLELIEKANIDIYILMAPLVMLSFSLFFIPIKLSDQNYSEKKMKPTKAMLSLFLFRAFIGKMSIFIFVHTVLSISLSMG